jgi:hypothetical protein
MLGKKAPHPAVILKPLIFVPPNIARTLGFQNQPIRRFSFDLFGLHPYGGRFALRYKRPLVDAAPTIQLINSRRASLGFDS